MPSRRLFVVRVGDPNGLWATWNPQNKWSTPEVPDGPSGQLVRNAWVEGHEVHVLFVGTGDVPLHYGVVCGVRARNPAMDANFPTRTENGELLCFMLLETLIPIRHHQTETFQTALDEIRYTRGFQIPISQVAASNIFVFYQGFISGQNTNLVRNPPTNDFINRTAVANPNATTNLPTTNGNI